MTTIARMQRANRASRFRAYRLHGSDPAQLDPFMAIDHAWMSAPTFPPHPHAGLSAVTYLFLDSETGIANRDSLGNSMLIQPGGLHWTAAGRGVVHEENPAVLGSTVHLLQIFVNLPQDRQGAAPFALSLVPQDVPVVQRPGVRVRVPLGSFDGVRSPLTPPTDAQARRRGRWGQGCDVHRRAAGPTGVFERAHDLCEPGAPGYGNRRLSRRRIRAAVTSPPGVAPLTT